MQSVKEAVEFYLPKKRSGEMSLGDIRHELQTKGEFSEIEINSICLNISDQELAGLNEKKAFSFDFLDHIVFNIFMILASITIFIFSFFKFDKLVKLSETYEVSEINYFVPGVFMVASTMFLIRHVAKIIKRSRKV